MEIYFSGTWGTITDSDWTNNDAQVVCRKMAHFKPGIYKIYYTSTCSYGCIKYICYMAIIYMFSLYIRVLLMANSKTERFDTPL